MSNFLGTLTITDGIQKTFQTPNSGVKAILIGNESGLTCTVTMQSGGVQKTLYPSVLDWFAVNPGFNGNIVITPQAILSNSSSFPATTLIFDAIGLNDPENASMYPLSFTRTVNSNVSTPAAIQNDGMTSGTSVVEATVLADSASAVSLTNNGVLSLGTAAHPGSISVRGSLSFTGNANTIQMKDEAGTNLTVMAFDGTTAKQLNVLDGASGELLNVKGNTKVSGTFEATGTATLDSNLTVTGSETVSGGLTSTGAFTSTGGVQTITGNGVGGLHLGQVASGDILNTSTTGLTLYGSSVADGTITTACDMASATGGAETSKQTVLADSNFAYAEITSQGSASQATVSAIPATPTGKGWVFQPGVTTFAVGSWGAIVTLALLQNYQFCQFQVRFFKYSGGIYTSIGSLPLISPTGNAKTAYTLTSTSMGSVSFGASDLIYVDMWIAANSFPTLTSQNPTVYVSSSSTQGVVNDVQISTAPIAGTYLQSAQGIHLQTPAGTDVLAVSSTGGTFSGTLGVTGVSTLTGEVDAGADVKLTANAKSYYGKDHSGTSYAIAGFDGTTNKQLNILDGTSGQLANIKSNTKVNGTLEATGAATLDSTLAVTGTSSLDNGNITTDGSGAIAPKYVNPAPASSTVTGTTHGSYTLYEYMRGTIKRVFVAIQTLDSNNAFQTLALPVAFTTYVSITANANTGAANGGFTPELIASSVAQFTQGVTTSTGVLGGFVNGPIDTIGIKNTTAATQTTGWVMLEGV